MWPVPVTILSWSSTRNEHHKSLSLAVQPCGIHLLNKLLNNTKRVITQEELDNPSFSPADFSSDTLYNPFGKVYKSVKLSKEHKCVCFALR